MNRSKIKFIIDILMFIVFLVIAISGFILWFILPRGSGKLGYSFILLREDWLFIHNWFSVLIVLLIIIHLILNWVWIKSMFNLIFKKKKTL